METKESPKKKSGAKPLPKTWHCDIYCRKVRHVTCEGEKGRRPDAPDLCPYFDEMLY